MKTRGLPVNLLQPDERFSRKKEVFQTIFINSLISSHHKHIVRYLTCQRPVHTAFHSPSRHVVAPRSVAASSSNLSDPPLFSRATLPLLKPNSVTLSNNITLLLRTLP